MNKYMDDKNSLNHGLGVGGGRGRPKGSRNGYINPNAAYMKDYKIVGEVANGDESEEYKQELRFNSQRNTYPRPQTGTGTQRNATGQPVQRVNTQKTASRPMNSVQSGKMLMEKYLGENTITEKTIPEKTIQENTAQETVMSEEYPNLTEYQVNEARSQGASESYLKQLNANSSKNVYFGYSDDGEHYQFTVDPSTGKTIRNDDPRWEEVVKETGIGQPVSPVRNAIDKVEEVARNTAQVAGDAATKAVEAAKGVYEDVKTKVDESLAGAGDTVKHWWDELLDWGTQAAKDVGNFATSAIDTGTKAFNDAAKWVGDRFNDATSWANTAYKDVSDWVGDRSKELDRWWNGYEEKQVYGNPEKRAERQESHVNGARENIANAVTETANKVGEAVNNAAGTAGKWLTDRAVEVGDTAKNAASNAGQWLTDRAAEVNDWWNGTDKVDGQGNATRTVDHTPGFREKAAEAIGEATDNVVRTVRDAAGNVHQAVVDTAGNIVGWVGERAEDVNTWWNGEDVVRGNSNGITSVEHTPGVRENIEEIVGAHVEKLRDAAGNARDAIVDAKGQFVDWVDDRIEEANEWWNGSDRVTGDQNGVTNVEHTPGARENIEKALEDTGTAAAEAVTTAGRTAAGATANLFGDNFIGMTNSDLAQEANRAGMPMATLYSLASTFLSGDSNSVNRQGFDNILMMYSDGRLNDNDIERIIENASRKQ